MLHTILIVDDEKSVRESLRFILEGPYRVLIAENGEKALQQLLSEKIDLMLLDIRMPGISGLEVLKQVENIARDVEVIIITADQRTDTAVDAINLGAYHYITKPFNTEELQRLVAQLLEKKSIVRENISLRSKISKATSLGEVIGRTEEMQKVIQEIGRAIRSDDTVVLYGESGTEKELIAYTIQQQSARGAAHFIEVQCAGASTSALEEELFGKEDYGPEDTFGKRVGALEAARDGVLFLNEVGALPPMLQEKLLNALQQKHFMRVDGKHDVPFSARLICASSVPLRRAVSQGMFNEELYHYINVLPIEIPALRQRKNDIPLLVDNIIQRYDRELGCSVEGVTEDALLILSAYDWPGNIAELEGLLERCVGVVRTGSIDVTVLPLQIVASGFSFVANKKMFSLHGLLERFRMKYINTILQQNTGNRLLTALQLKIDRTLVEKAAGRP